MNRDVEKLGERIAQIGESVDNLLQHGVGIGHSSFDDGALQQYTDGVLGSTFGTQWDGTNGVVPLNGPPPPTPRWSHQWGPEGEGVVGGLRLRWEGFFVGSDNIPAPGDFKHVEFYVSDQQTPSLAFENLKTTITSARGGEVLVPLPVLESGYYVWMVARSTTGRTSGFSEVIGPFHPEKIREEDLGFDIGALSGSQIFWGTAQPVTDSLGDLWLKLPQEQAYRYTPSGWQLTADQVSVVAAMKEAIGTRISSDGSANLTTGEAFTKGIAPHSLIASDVIATGTVSAALLESILVLANTIIAGNPNSTHVKITPQGVFIFADDPIDGTPNEVGRMGTSSNDFFGITGADGMLVTALDQTGSVNARTANFREDIVVAGRPVSEQIKNTAGGLVGRWAGPINGLEFFAQVKGIRDTYGIAQFNFPVVQGRMYLLSLQGPTWYTAFGTGDAFMQFRVARNASVTTTSELLWEWPHPEFFQDARVRRPFVLDWVADFTGMVSIGVTMTMFNPSNAEAHIKIVEGSLFSAMAFDMGPSIGFTGGNQSSMGGQLMNGAPAAPPPAVQSYFKDLAPVGWQSWRGNGSLRTDVPGPVQGPDPSGTNGDGSGHWWFDVPSITGTVTRMEFYAYASQTYFNDGGNGLFRPAIQGLGGPNYTSPRGKWLAGRWPKPGGLHITLPTDWYPLFRNGGTPGYGDGRANGIIVGNGDGNLQNYVRFDGPSARLRIWYTQ